MGSKESYFFFNLVSHLCYASQTGRVNIQKSHRTTGCFDDRLLTMMTDAGFYVP